MEMSDKIKLRAAWVEMYQQTQNAGLVCRRCGTSRPTFRKWIRRYQQLGLAGLVDQSRRPIHCEPKKIFALQKQWILQLRQTRKLGARRLQKELERLYGLSLSTATIHKVLKQAPCQTTLKN